MTGPDHERTGMVPRRNEDKQGIRFLVESALRKVASDKKVAPPRDREGWIVLLCEALTDEADDAHQRVIASMISNGISTDDVFQVYVPEASRFLGELWVQDRASFVDVTVGASRLQALFRSQPDGGGNVLSRSIPLGQAVLMVVPEFEDHSIGAFVAADQFRRHGVWVHMAIGMEHGELCELVRSGRFAMIGITAGSMKTVERLKDLIEYLRRSSGKSTPIVVGGHLVGTSREVERQTGADFSVRTAREAIELCGLASVVEPLTIDTSP